MAVVAFGEFGQFRQQNTFTGRLTPAMVREVLIQSKDAAGLP